MRRNWIKIYVDQCLRGTMISELSASERWVWIGLLLMAGDSNEEGIIFRRKDAKGGYIGFSTTTFAETLDVEEEEFNSATKQMIKHNKIKIDKNNVIKIVNWSKYQSEYQRQRPYRTEESYRKSSNLSCNQSNALDRDRDIEGDKEESIKKKVVTFDFNKRKFLNITTEDKAGWFDAYPALNIEEQLKRMREWLLANPAKSKSNYRKFIANWLSRQEEKGGEMLSYDEKRKKELKDWEKEPMRGE